MTDDSLLRSIERDLKNEQYKRLWKKIQPWVLSGVVFVVLSVSGSVAYVQYQTNLREGWGEKLHQAIVDINEKSWEQAEQPVQELIDHAATGYRSLAQFQSAALYARNGNSEKAAQLYQKLHLEAPTQPLRDLALVLWAYQQLDTEKPQVIINRLQPLFDANNPWHPSALEISAYAHLKQNNRKEAQTLFEQLTEDATVPQGIQNRARDMLVFIGQ
ncbi:MAG: tetratricopeptide repeat protein [Alphaproteobacteria bacterium GM202ARS2]|nr:tetratricopeptide repeat protein [Alphaproteobacteria bacterium GM202ARS2]